MSDSDPRCPYPGLRPFRRDEADLFFGREEQVDQLLDKLAETRFVAVLGTSGSGKSSLVRAGLLPALDSGVLAGAPAMPLGPGASPPPATCYRAANWICVGETQGRGKLGDHRLGQVPIKTVWVYPLAKDVRGRLSR